MTHPTSLIRDVMRDAYTVPYSVQCTFARDSLMRQPQRNRGEVSGKGCN
jgi:hypothetical protein